MPFVRVSDITMYCEIHGEGTPLVYIPGWGTEITTVSEQIADFAKKFRVIAIDKRGTGRTDRPDERYSIEQMADDTICLTDALKIRRAHILGISMGSMVAQAIAAKYPDRVNGLLKNPFSYSSLILLQFLAKAVHIG